jgi:hypothetical protein
VRNYGADFEINPGWKFLGTLSRLGLHFGVAASANQIVSHWIEVEMGIRGKHGPFGKKYDV